MILLTTERLLLEEASLEDTEFFLNLVNSPNWIEFIGDRGIKTRNDAREYIDKSLLNSYTKNGYGLYKMCLTTTKTPIGICGFIKRDYLDAADIGFAILPEYEGKGYTYEAAQATMEYGKFQLKLNTILALTTKENYKSRQLLSKIGLSEIGKIRPNKDENEFLLFSNRIEKSVDNDLFF